VSGGFAVDTDGLSHEAYGFMSLDGFYGYEEISVMRKEALIALYR